MRTLNFSVSPAQPAWTYNNIVRTIRYNSASGDAPINVRSATGSDFDFIMYPGDLVPLEKEASGIIITSPTGATVDGVITAGAALLSSNRIVGSVDLGRADSTIALLNGQTVHVKSSVNNTAGLYGCAQYWCTSGSLELKRLRVTAGSAGLLCIAVHNAALVNLVAGAHNKLNAAGSPAGFQHRFESLGAQPGTIMEYFQLAANVEREINLKDYPAGVTSGNGIVISHQTLAAFNMQIYADVVVR